MSKIEEFDINDLVIQLHDEIKLAFHVAQLDQLEGRLSLHAVKARLGRKVVTDDPDSPVPSNLLYADKYPNEEDWEVEVSYEPDQLRRPQETAAVRALQQYVLLDKVADQPISTVKGVSTYWERVLFEEGMQTLGEFARIPHEEVARLSEAYNSFSLLDFYAKVSLLEREFVILNHGEFGDTPFLNLLLTSEQALKRTFNNKLSSIEIAELKRIASLLLVVFDKKVFERFRLNLLFD